MENPGGRHTIYKLLAKLAFELVTIIAGILIALFVNNIQERNRDLALLDNTLNALSREFDKNVDNINKIQYRLERFRDTLNFYSKNTDLSIYDITTKAPGLTVADLYNTNWQAALSSNSLRLLSFETITQLSQIDAKHQELRGQAEILTDIIYSPSLYKRGHEGMPYRRVLEEWLGGYLGNERELIVLYDQFKDLIKQRKME